MEQIWPGFCCEGFDFIAMDCDDSRYGYGICLNPDCSYGDIVQAFQLDSEEEFELDDEYASLFQEGGMVWMP